jgi:hypothetical protein
MRTRQWAQERLLHLTALDGSVEPHIKWLVQNDININTSTTAPPSVANETEASGLPSLLLGVVMLQLMGTIANVIGQHVSRRYFKSSKQRLLALQMASFAVVIGVLGVLEVSVPNLQGPVSVWPLAIAHWPLLAGVASLFTAYHVAEVAAYSHHWGMLLKPVASLMATFLIPIFQRMAQVNVDKSIPWFAVLMAVAGTLLVSHDDDGIWLLSLAHM